MLGEEANSLAQIYPTQRVKMRRNRENRILKIQINQYLSIAPLTIYDMCIAVDRGMCIENVRLLEKKGGKSGHWLAD